MDPNNDPLANPVPPRQSYVPAPYLPPSGPPAKSPMLAAFFSALMPALGHVYVGVYQRAAIIFLVWIGVFGAAIKAEGTDIGMLVPVVVFLWLFNIFDAYRQATFAVWGEPEEIRLLTRERGKNGLSFGVALLAIGLYGLLSRYFDLDLSFLLDHWYLMVMAAGGWMVWQAVAASRASADSQPD